MSTQPYVDDDHGESAPLNSDADVEDGRLKLNLNPSSCSSDAMQPGLDAPYTL